MTSTQQDDVLRALPHAVGPEKSILSSMLQDPQEFIGLALDQGLSAEHFYLPSHSTLFRFICELFDAGIEIEIVSLIQRLLDRGLLDRCGGASEVAGLYTYAPSSGHFRHHLKHVKDKFVLRSLIQAGNETIAAAYDAPDEVEALVDATEERFLSIRDANEASGPSETLKTSVEKFLESLQTAIDGKSDLPGLKTGFDELDRKSGGGMKPGDMFVVAARPSMGKTAFMMNIVENVAMDQKKPCGVFSVEMSLDQLVSRLVASRAKFAMSQLARGYTPNRGDLQRIQRAAMETVAAKDKLFVDTRPGITISQLRAKARRWKRDHGIEFIAIDYLQLMRSKTKQAEGNREREIAEISAGIKGLAKELGIPILVLAQLNRGPEARTGKSLGVPRMSDLRESGSIEQDADMVGLLYRTAYYAQDDEQREAEAGYAKLILAKNRNGETGDIPLTFIAEITRFETGVPHQEPKQQPKGRFND